MRTDSQSARKERPAIAHGGQPAHKRHTCRAECIEVERRPLRRADQLRRWQSSGAARSSISS